MFLLMSAACVIKDHLRFDVLDSVSLFLLVGVPETLLEQSHFPVVTRPY